MHSSFKEPSFCNLFTIYKCLFKRRHTSHSIACSPFIKAKAFPCFEHLFADTSYFWLVHIEAVLHIQIYTLLSFDYLVILKISLIIFSIIFKTIFLINQFLTLTNHFTIHNETSILLFVLFVIEAFFFLLNRVSFC